jgi:hypothetical protein
MKKIKLILVLLMFINNSFGQGNNITIQSEMWYKSDQYGLKEYNTENFANTTIKIDLKLKRLSFIQNNISINFYIYKINRDKDIVKLILLDRECHYSIRDKFLFFKQEEDNKIFLIKEVNYEIY